MKRQIILLCYLMAGAVGVLAVAAYVCCFRWAGTPRQLSAPARTDSQSSDQTDSKETSVGEHHVLLGRLLGTNNPAIPPVVMRVGRQPGEDEGPDLSTPTAAVHSVLSLIDQDATDKLASCFVEETAATADSLYPCYLGHPTELVEVVDEGESAVVTWNATVHTAFSLNGKSWSAGETMTLTTR